MIIFIIISYNIIFLRLNKILELIKNNKSRYYNNIDNIKNKLKN